MEERTFEKLAMTRYMKELLAAQKAGNAERFEKVFGTTNNYFKDFYNKLEHTDTRKVTKLENLAIIGLDRKPLLWQQEANNALSQGKKEITKNEFCYPSGYKMYTYGTGLQHSGRTALENTKDQLMRKVINFDPEFTEKFIKNNPNKEPNLSYLRARASYFDNTKLDPTNKKIYRMVDGNKRYGIEEVILNRKALPQENDLSDAHDLSRFWGNGSEVNRVIKDSIKDGIITDFNPQGYKEIYGVVRKIKSAFELKQRDTDLYKKVNSNIDKYTALQDKHKRYGESNKDIDVILNTLLSKIPSEVLHGGASVKVNHFDLTDRLYNLGINPEEIHEALPKNLSSKQKYSSLINLMTIKENERVGTSFKEYSHKFHEPSIDLGDGGKELKGIDLLKQTSRSGEGNFGSLCFSSKTHGHAEECLKGNKRAFTYIHPEDRAKNVLFETDNDLNVLEATGPENKKHSRKHIHEIAKKLKLNINNNSWLH